MNQNRQAALDALFGDLPPMLTAEEVAALLHLTRQNTYTWLREGVIPGYKFGASWRVSRDELKEYMRRNANALQDSEAKPSNRSDKED